MSQLQWVFTRWFVALMTFFLLANLAGVARPLGLKPFRSAGFPFTIVAWGVGVAENFDWLALALNAAVAVGVSAVVALVCARASRSRPAQPALRD
ncbi:MAG TPA: hypothetical protein VF590_05850 [Isosphaeraceae bacterium]